MGFLDKMKNLFTEPEEEMDEEIEIEQIKKEKPSSEPKPVVEKKREKYSDIEETREFVEPDIPEKKSIDLDISEPVKPQKTRESMKTPIFFTENDFADLEPERPKKVEKKREIEYRQPSIKKEEKKPYGGTYSSTTILTTEKPTFKPTPIISPIYGILDKNYSKDDIVDRNELRDGNKAKSNGDRFDQVRNKAYGKLENELEETIYNAPKEAPKKKKVEEEIDLFDELELESKPSKPETLSYHKDVDLSRNVVEQEQNIKELDEVTMDLTKELDNLLLQRETYSDKKKKIERETASNEDDMTENELFNIIDSIYEEGKE